MTRAYLDSNMVIAIVEDGPPGAAYMREWLRQHVGPAGAVVVSDLVRVECRVKPLRTGDTSLLADYDRYFAQSDVGVARLTPSVCDRAAEIRAHERRSLADALHLAAAIEAGCDVFVTADQRLRGFAGLPVVVLSP